MRQAESSNLSAVINNNHSHGHIMEVNLAVLEEEMCKDLKQFVCEHGVNKKAADGMKLLDLHSWRLVETKVVPQEVKNPKKSKRVEL